jgi:hypothetical protein
MSQDDDGELDPDFSAAQFAVLARIEADEAAFERLTELFVNETGRVQHRDTEVFQWGAHLDDLVLIELGFEGRAGFQYNFDVVLMVEQGPRGKDTVN